MSNPHVLEAKGTPMPCTPVVLRPWSDFSEHVNLHGSPAITEDSTLECQLGGEITVAKADLSHVDVKG